MSAAVPLITTVLTFSRYKAVYFENNYCKYTKMSLSVSDFSDGAYSYNVINMRLYNCILDEIMYKFPYESAERC